MNAHTMSADKGPPEGFTFACHHCKFIFPHDITVGVIAAHMGTEHDLHGTEIEVDLVPLGGQP